MRQIRWIHYAPSGHRDCVWMDAGRTTRVTLCLFHQVNAYAYDHEGD
jgi:hypothetical protein